MWLIVAGAFAVGGVIAFVLTRGQEAGEPTVDYEFMETVEHSPEFRARQAAAAAAAAAASTAVAVEKPLAAAAPAVAAPAAPRKIAIIGDSIAAGPAAFPPRVRVPGAVIRYKGWGGEQAVAITRKAIKEKVVDADLTDVVLEAGVNNIASEIVGQQRRKQALDGDRAAANVIRDLGAAIGLIRAAAPRAQVWLLKMPPWRGYTKYFGAGKATAAPILAATDAVDAWLAAHAGQPDGPDRVIDTAPLGDADGRYLPGLSKDQLHPRGKGVDALAARVSDALTKGTDMSGPAVVGVMTAELFDATVGGALAEAGAAELEALAGLDGPGAAVGAEEAGDPDDFDAADASPAPVDVWSVLGAAPAGGDWPAGWRTPSAKVAAAVTEASAEFAVPEDYIWAVMRKESHFDPSLRGYRALAASYARNRDVKIPGGGGLTWGEKFDEDGWRAYGLMQVLPFNLFGVKGILKASDPISKAFDVRTNVRAGARVLKILRDKYGNWEDAVWRYNGSKAYMRQVLAFRDELLAARPA